MENFGNVLKKWRMQRRLSQMSLALEVGVSPRHLSFLETGRSGPSRGLILRLAEILETPRDDRNVMLTTAGFAPLYGTVTLADEDMERVRQAMNWTLDRHMPYPAVVLDRLWVLQAMNETAKVLFQAAGLETGGSLIDALLDPSGIRTLIENWAEVGHMAQSRLRLESRAQGGVAELDRAADLLSEDPLLRGYDPPTVLPPVVPTIYRAGDAHLSVFSTIAHFGSAEDIALADLRIELMFPADDATENFFRAAAQRLTRS